MQNFQNKQSGQNLQNSQNTQDTQNLLEVKGLCFSYGNSPPVLKDISFLLQQGQKTALLGKNGQGKSTLLNIITGFLKCQQGQVKIAGKTIKDYSTKQKAKIIAYISQGSATIPSFYTVKDYVIEGKRAYRKWGHYTKEDYLLLDDILQKCNLTKYKDTLTKDLSGGEKQRLIFAQSLIKDAKIYIFDESASNLDIEYQKQFFSLLDMLLCQKPCCVLFSLHDINLAVQNASNILLLNDGSVLYNGSAKDISQDTLSKAFCIKVTTQKPKDKRVFFY